MNRLPTVFCIPVIFALVVSCKGDSAPETEVLRPVKYVTTSFNSGDKTRVFSGVAKAGTETRLSFKVGGTVQAVHVKIGQAVRRNQAIASLDASDYVLQYEEADAAVKSADAVEKQARSNYERVRSLYEDGNASLSEYESAKAGYESAKANEKAGKQRRKLAESQIGYARLFAPVRGVIADVNVEENENVNPGKPVVIMNSGSEIEVEIQIPEVFITRIQPGDRVQVRFSAIKDRHYEGQVSEVAFSTSRTETTYPVMIRLKESSDDIRPGMAADVLFRFPGQTGEATITVPAIAVSQDKEGNFVYTVKEVEKGIGLIERKMVRTGELTPEGIELLEGIGTGEQVVTAGVSKIFPGMRVTI